MLRKILRNSFSSARIQKSNKKYVLSQFPYPSGDLHLGHARVYYIGDAISTYYKLKNYEVIYPIGWDSFGLPAENAAIIHKKNPQEWTESNISRMKDQLNHLGVNFNWQMELTTSTPEYYRWTQQIFVKMFKKGLAYKKMAEVNWDPVDKTVLANQQVDQNGCSWRSGAKVEKKMLNQWFLKITHYAEQLQNNLQNLQWIQKVKNMQKGWIGYKKGFKITLKLQLTNKQAKQTQVFFENAQDWSTATFIIKKMDATNQQNQKQLQNHSEIVGIVKNPFTNIQIPVILSAKQQSDCFVIVTQNDIKQSQNYRDLIKMHGLSTSQQTAQSGKNSIAALRNKYQVKQVNKMKIKDWLISRQRFWGCPIPIIECKTCGPVPVPEDTLPVILPQWKNDGNPLLKDDFKQCICPKCGSTDALRQSDTMDTFVDSSWYYLRFRDNKNSTQIFSKEKVSHMMPVDIYIGGIQHAIMHLLYARFIMRFITNQYSLSQTCIEPFKQLVVQGLVKGKTLCLKQNGQYISQKDIDEGKYQIQDCRITFQKMSKSKFNGLNPNILVDKFGADALRVALFFANPPDRDIDFSQEIVVNADKFLKKVQNLSKQILSLTVDARKQTKQILQKDQLLQLKNIFEKMQISIQKRQMHTYVANVMEMFNLIKQLIEKQQTPILMRNNDKIKLFAIFVRVLKIIAPKTSTDFKQKLVSKFGDILKSEQFDKWPSDQLFGGKIQLLVMKGKKMISKQTVDMNLTDQQLIKQLKLQKMNVQQIKKQKKKFIVILKD